MSMRPKIPTPVELRKARRRARSLPRTPTLIERERALAENAVDRVRLDWLSQGEDTGTSNLYALWQSMLSRQPGDLREVIDFLRKKRTK